MGASTRDRDCARTFVFTTDGALAGLCVSHDGQAAIVPTALLFSAVDRLQQQSGEAGDLGIAIQPLSPAIASATGASDGRGYQR